MNRIREVWAGNLEQEMATLRDLVDQYPYIGLVSSIRYMYVTPANTFWQKTEFPGIVARPIGNFKNQNEFQYQTMRCNVELLKVIQIGITLSDADGNLPPEPCTWQFNFRFDLECVVLFE
jgi:CCR4-NOT transcription complex subunit 7/8